MHDQENPYFSYLLRLWLVQNHSHQEWRCSLQNVHTGERHGFANPEALCEFLGEKISLAPEGDLDDDVFVE